MWVRTGGVHGKRQLAKSNIRPVSVRNTSAVIL